MSAIRDLSLDERQRLVEQAGLHSWPVVIRVNRTKTAYGVITAHRHATGSLVTFMSVGAASPVDDTPVAQEDGTIEIVPGIASAMLEVVEQTNLRIIA